MSKQFASARKEADALAVSNPKLMLMARKFCAHNQRDPDLLIYLHHDGMYQPMMQWMAYLNEAAYALASLEAHHNVFFDDIARNLFGAHFGPDIYPHEVYEPISTNKRIAR